MKKITFLFAILLGMVFSSVAQPKIGVRAGYNLTRVAKLADLDDYEYGRAGFDWKSAANFGVTIDLRKSERFVFRPGIYFSMKGFKDNGSMMPVTNLNYLEMPLLAVFQISLGEKTRLEFQIGPYVAYGVCGKYKFESGVVKKNDSFESVYTKFPSFKDGDFKRFDLGGNAGLGINYEHYYLGASYELGTTFIMTDAPNHCISVNLGYIF
ncbi:MAG: porin family protein [Bacteroidales bacterium]|nr:porin family protein [Bacteroidales bacterium]